MHIVLLKIHLEIFLWFVYCAYRTRVHLFPRFCFCFSSFYIMQWCVYSFWSSSFPHFYYKYFSFFRFLRFVPAKMRTIHLQYSKAATARKRRKMIVFDRLKEHFYYINFLIVQNYNILIETIGMVLPSSSQFAQTNVWMRKSLWSYLKEEKKTSRIKWVIT